MIGPEQPVDELDDRRPGEPQKPLKNEVEYLLSFPLDSLPLDNPRRPSRLRKLYKTRLSLSNFVSPDKIAG
jgi:hypothetical protein